MQRVTSAPRGARGFSLIELAIVVAIVAVIAALAIPRLSGMVERSREGQVAETIRTVQLRIEEEYQCTRAYPPVLQRSWFRGGTIENSLFPGETTTIENVDQPGALHPAAKWTDGSLPLYWYNRGNGEFRARVPVQSTAAAGLRLYGKVNGVSVSESQVVSDANIDIQVEQDQPVK